MAWGLTENVSWKISIVKDGDPFNDAIYNGPSICKFNQN